MLTKYSDYIGSTAHVLNDNILNATRILPPPMFMPSRTSRFQPYADGNPLALPSSSAVDDSAAEQSATLQVRNPAAKIAKARVAKVPRPPNAFILYRQHHHHRIRRDDPDIKNNDISRRVGAMWAGERKEVKEYYQRKAVDLKAQHAKLHPDYQYAPRKASEKKRRTSQKKRVATVSPVDPPTMKPLLPDQLIPLFTDENDPEMLMHELVPGQVGLTDQMAEKHNDSIGSGLLLAGETPPPIQASLSDEAYEDQQVYNAGIPHEQIFQKSLQSSPQDSSPTAISSSQDLRSTTINPQDIFAQSVSQVEAARMNELSMLMEGNDYFLAPINGDFEEVDFTPSFNSDVGYNTSSFDLSF